MQMMEQLHCLELQANKLTASQVDLKQARDTKTTPMPAERRTTQERRLSSSSEAMAEKVKETAIRLALQGVPAKHIIPRVIAEAKEEERRMM